MSEPPAERSGTGKFVGRTGFDFLSHLGAFLDGPPPLSLLVTGGPGTGKSTLLRTLIPRLKGPGFFVAYKTDHAGSDPDLLRPSGGPLVSLLFVGPSGEGPPDRRGGVTETDRLVSFAPANLPEGEELPRPIVDAVARLAAAGGGFAVCDSWDAASEAEFRRAGGPSATVEVLSSSVAFMRGTFGEVPVRSVIAASFEPDPEMLSAADGIVRLEWEEVAGFRLRVVSILKLRRTPAPETRYLYTLDGGVFRCPPQFPRGFRPPVGPPDPDPEPDEESLFPGSVAFADAFGRLRYQGLTGIDVPPRFPSAVADVFLYPLAAHTIASGGRVVWIPSPMSGPLQVATQLSRFVRPDFLRDRLRVLSAAGRETGLGDLAPVALSIRRERSEEPGARPGPPAAGAPLFPHAYRFLQETPEHHAALFVLYLDGLRALGAVGGFAVEPRTLPMIVGTYARLPRFHGFGFARADDPLEEPLAEGVDIQVHVEERYGRTVLFGTRPRTHPFILDWPEAGGRYALIPVT
jgi:hypothetical protein